MLSKNNKILIGCLALLLVMSVGYALFSDTITINGSATAKGDFTLTTTCDEVEPSNVSNKGSVTESTITCNNNIVNASATLDYPGSDKWFRVMVTNEGTIPAKLKRIVELNDPERMIFDKDNYPSYGIENCQGDDSNRVCSVLVSDVNFLDDYETDNWGVDFSWYEEQLDAVLDPGETAYFYIEMRWNAGSTTPGDPLTASLNAELTWEQATE